MSKMNQEILNYIVTVADERQIPRDAVVDGLKIAIEKAYKKEFDEELIEVNINLDEKILEVNKLLNVVDKPLTAEKPEDELNDYCEISVKDANAYAKKMHEDKTYAVGDVLKQPIELAKLPKKVVEHIIQLFKQANVSQANNQIYLKWKDRIGEVINAEVERNDKYGIQVDLGGGYFGYMALKDAIPNETLIPGQKYAFFIKEVKQQSAGWPIILSRADAGLVKFLLKTEVPEIQEGIVEIVNIARIAGFKTKVAVISHQPGVEPCGTVIGPHGSRITAVKSQICNESIEVFEYDDDHEKYLVDVCSPARIVGYKVMAEATDERKQQLVVIVPPDQLPLLVGRKGANIRLISKILDADVDVKTPDDAKYDNIEYNRVEVKSIQQRRIERIYSQNEMSVDDFSRFNKPKKVVYKKEEPTTTVASEHKSTQTSYKKPTTPTVHNAQSSTASLLDSIDSFDFNKATAEETSSDDKFSTLKANEEKRQSTGTTSSLEDVFDTKQQPKKQAKKSKKSSKKETISTPTSSILDEFKDKDSESLLQELVSENSSREEDSDDNTDDYDYEE